MRTKKGFTLVEVAVAIAVFMVFITIVMRSFIHLLGVQIEANRYRKLYSELNEVMTLISTDVREYAIDYQCFTSSTCNRDLYHGNIIAFISPDLLERRILKAEPVEDEEGNTRYELSYAIQKRQSRQTRDGQQIGWDTAENYQRIDTENTVFTDLRFAVYPLEDPYSEATAIERQNLFQPSLTIFAEVKSKSYLDKPGIVMQTVVSSRQYNVSSDIR